MEVDIVPKDILWTGGAIKISRLFICTVSNISANSPESLAARRHYMEEFTLQRDANGRAFPKFQDFVENTTRLVIITDKDDIGTRRIVCIFTLNLIRDSNIVELYDFNANRNRPYIRGESTDALVTFLNEVIRLKPDSNRILWLGTTKETYAEMYMRKGFCYLESLDAFTETIAVPGTLPIFRDSITPLGTYPPARFISLIAQLNAPIVPPPSRIICRAILRVSSEVLTKQLHGRVAKFNINISKSHINELFKAVMEQDSERSIIFANNRNTKSRAIAEDLVWNGDGYNVELDMGFSDMRSNNRVVPALSENILTKHVVGHTHPAFLYAYYSNYHGRDTDLAPPSFTDIYSMVSIRTSAHIVFSVECMYLMNVNPKVLQAEYDFPQSDRDILERLKVQLFDITKLYYVDSAAWGTSVIVAEYAIFKYRQLSGTFIGLPDNIERVLRAKFIIAKLNEWLTLPDGSKLVEISIHLWPPGETTLITPAISLSTATPNTIFNTDPTDPTKALRASLIPSISKKHNTTFNFLKEHMSSPNFARGPHSHTPIFVEDRGAGGAGTKKVVDNKLKSMKDKRILVEFTIADILAVGGLPGITGGVPAATGVPAAAGGVPAAAGVLLTLEEPPMVAAAHNPNLNGLLRSLGRRPLGKRGGSRKKVSSHSRRKNKKNRKTRKH